jgi:membrane-associated protease RseP (regulator of RpoE activity)
MWNQYFHRLKLGAASAALAGASLGGVVSAQTLPIAGNPREAVAQDREAIRGVREQDEAAARTANALNRDARQEARQGFGPTSFPRTGEANLRRDARGDLRNTAAMNSGLRGADLGLWFNTRPEVNGLVVADVANQGAFANVGIREGDRIMSINGQPMTSESQFVQALSSPNAGPRANIVIDRNGVAQILSVQPSAVMSGVVAPDPLYQAGLTLNQTNPNHLVVSQVFPRTPAFYAGLRPGDVINQVNGNPISSPIALTQAMSGVGGILNMQVNRNGQTRQLNLEIGDAAIRTVMRPSASLPIGQSNSNNAGMTVPSSSLAQPISGAQSSAPPLDPAGPTNASAIGTGGAGASGAGAAAAGAGAGGGASGAAAGGT